MRVLHVIASSRGGGAVHLRRLARRQVEEGHEVRVLMPEEGELTEEALRSLGIAHRDPGRLGPGRVSALIRHLDDPGPDVLHCHGARAALYARLAALAVVSRRPAVVYSLHGFTAPYRPWLRRGAMWAGEHALAPLTDAYVAGSQAERSDVLAFGLDPERIHVVCNGMDPAPFGNPDRAAARRRLGEPEDARLLVAVCRLDQPRDPALLVEVLAALADPRARLLLAGDGPLRAVTEQTAITLGVGDRVRLLGYVQDLPTLLAAGDVFLHATRGWEGGVPLAMLEAMAAGLPVVATDAGGIPEGVVEQQTGLLVERGDTQGMTAATRLLLADPELGRRFGAAGRARVKARFTIDAMIDGYRALYRQVTGR